jgi:hypothetical protein
MSKGTDMNTGLARLRGTSGGTRVAFLTLAVAFSAGIHAALVPEHLEEMPRLGDAFVVAAVVGGLIACGLALRPDELRLQVLAGIFCLGQIGVWAAFVTVAVPGFAGTPEPVEPIALLSKAAEAIAVLLALPAMTARAGRDRSRATALGGSVPT